MHMKVLITGPCGSGKTTIITELTKKGYKTSAALEKEFWFEKDEVESFEHGIMNNRIKVYKELQGKGLVFFDRGVVDPIAYRKYEGNEIPSEFDEIAKKYLYDLVFVLKPLDTHEPNPEHDHLIKTPEDAQRWFDHILETLNEYGYAPIIIDNLPVEERIEFILDQVKKST
ncbi:hypothetical protein CMI48_03425 [Candidatus Pacearchaeota archaeon]|nr:hypothetical protein [Candidatus Pacearchaeota archaeon]|tara:strand:- start:476 stop:988 length:513 start_codon:yes stop_codon:yes gene_type:complete